MFIVSWILGSVFLVAGVAKIRGRRQFTLAIGALVRSATARRAIGWVFPLVEVCAGSMLLIAPLRGPGSVLAIALCLLFVLIALDTMASKRVLDCNCFGPFSRGVLGTSGLVRNILLLGLAVIVVVQEHAVSLTQLMAVLLIISAIISIAVFSWRLVVRHHDAGVDASSFPILINPNEYVGMTLSTEVLEHVGLDAQSILDKNSPFFNSDGVNQDVNGVRSVLIIGNDGCEDCKVLDETLRHKTKIGKMEIVIVKSFDSPIGQGNFSTLADNWYRVVLSNDIFATVLPCALFMNLNGEVLFVEEGSTGIVDQMEKLSNAAQRDRSYVRSDPLLVNP